MVSSHRYRCEETGEYLGERSLNTQEVKFANLMANVQQNLQTNKPVQAFETLLHAIRVSHPTSGEQAILNYLNQARDNYAYQNPQQFEEVQNYIQEQISHKNTSSSQQHSFSLGNRSSDVKTEDDETFEDALELLSSLHFGVPPVPSPTLAYQHQQQQHQQPLSSFSTAAENNCIPTEFSLMNEVYHALLKTSLEGPSHSRIGSTSKNQRVQLSYNTPRYNCMSGFESSDTSTPTPTSCTPNEPQWVIEEREQQQAALLDQQGLGMLLDLALEDGSSVHCRQCNGVIPTNRFQNHVQYWCDGQKGEETNYTMNGVQDQGKTTHESQSLSQGGGLLQQLQSAYPTSHFH